MYHLHAKFLFIYLVYLLPYFSLTTLHRLLIPFFHPSSHSHVTIDISRREWKQMFLKFPIKFILIECDSFLFFHFSKGQVEKGAKFLALFHGKKKILSCKIMKLLGDLEESGERASERRKKKKKTHLYYIQKFSSNTTSFINYTLP